MLFGKNLEQNFYNYCPAFALENEILHVWYCTNKESGNITDYVGYRQGVLKNNHYVFSEEMLVLDPTKNTWDSRHVCDPAVTKGVFEYKGETYFYLMAYLGCVTDDCCDNETGIALAKNIEGPWVKYDLNPLIPFIGSPDFVRPHFHWGYGQPALLSVDGEGKVIIFYNVGIDRTFTRAELWDLSEVDKPQKLYSHDVINEGYVNIEGDNDVIGNADFAYDAQNHILYAVGDMRGKREDDPCYISNALPILKAQLDKRANHSLLALFLYPYVWEVLDYVDEKKSGFSKNHNPGILKDAYGRVNAAKLLRVAYTVSDLNKKHPEREGIWQSLHTYRIYEYIKELKGGEN